MQKTARKPLTHPRKRPKQERSRATVEAILEAAARILVQEGLQQATTNRIAEVAGVSIGSLYQYFPNKESLVRALLEQHVEEALAQRPEALRHNDLPLRERIRLAVEWHLAVHAASPALHQALTACVPEILGSDAIRTFERTVQTHHPPRAAATRGRASPEELGHRSLLCSPELGVSHPRGGRALS